MFCLAYIHSNQQKPALLNRKSKSAYNNVLMNIFGKFFKWANRFYMLPAWIDAKVMPRSLSAVLLIKAEKN
jgi:hypothetical protein